MPYLKRHERTAVTPHSAEPAETPGELCFQLVEVVNQYCDHAQVESFCLYAEILGALEATKLEFYRRLVAPYEQKKLLENGEAFTKLEGIIEGQMTKTGVEWFGD